MLYIRVYIWFKKTWGKTPSKCQDCIITILRKQVFKQAVGRVEEKIEILAILNKYKDIFEDLVDSLDMDTLDVLRPVDKKPYNVMLGLENPLTEP